MARLMDGESMSVSLGCFLGDLVTLERADDVMALLVHLGYLGWDEEGEVAFIPNCEVMEHFREAMAP